MIIVLVKYECKNGKRDQFLHAIKENGIDVASRNENGNIMYDYSYDTENNNVLVLTELWKDEDSIKKHSLEKHFLMLGELKKNFVIDTDIKRYVASEYSL